MKILTVVIFLFISSSVIGQVVGKVDKRTKEFRIPRNDMGYQYFGYQIADTTSKKMICFSSHENDVRANYSNCPLGSYYDTDKMRPGDKIQYVGITGPFAKMIFIAYDGKKTLFFISKKCLVVK